MKEISQHVTLADLAMLAETVLGCVHTNVNPMTASVISLSGDLGAGKTTFVQTLARVLQVEEVVTSPTFTVMKQYIVQHKNPYGIERLVHMDAYRLESIAEVGPLRLAEILATPRTLLCIEWAEKIAEILPADTLKLEFKSVSETERQVTITSPEVSD